MASNLYGTPNSPTLTSAYAGTPYGTAIDPMQVASATNTVPKSSANWGGIFSAGMNTIGGLWNASVLEAQNNQTISDLRYMFRRNRDRIMYDLNKQQASDELSFFSSGVMPTSGSAAGVLASNRNIVMDNIADEEHAVNRQVQNLQAQTKNAWTSAIISGAGSLVGAIL